MRFQFLAVALSSTVITVGAMPPVRAQIPFLPTVQTSTNGSSESDTRDVSRWVYLDGRGLFQVAAPRANISERLQQIERNLAEISQGYFQDPNAKLDIQVNDSGPSPIISINGLYLMTVTSQDANLRQAPPSGAANLIVQTLEDELEQARQERRPQYLIRQGVIAGTTGIGMIVLSWGYIAGNAAQNGIYYSQYHRLHQKFNPLPHN